MTGSAATGQTVRDRLSAVPWSRTLGPFVAFDQGFTIRTTDEELADFLDEAYAPMAAPSTEDVAVYSLLPPVPTGPGAVFRDAELIGESTRPSQVLGYLIWAINRQVIERSTGRLILHAACASLNGGAVALPAPMEAGKTTLVAGLVDRGMSYLTDEALAIAPDLTVEGYPKPLSVDPGSWKVLPHLKPTGSDHLLRYFKDQWQVPAQRTAPVAGPTPLQLIVFPQYKAGASFTVERLSPSDAVMAAVPCTFAPDGKRLGVERITQLGAITESVPAVRLVSADLSAACEWVASHLG